MTFAIAVWTVIGLAILLVVVIYAGPIVGLPLLVALIVVYAFLRRSRAR